MGYPLLHAPLVFPSCYKKRGHCACQVHRKFSVPRLRSLWARPVSMCIAKAIPDCGQVANDRLAVT